MKKSTKLMLVGGIVSFTCMWLGAYVVNEVVVDTWMLIPTSMTFAMAFVAGCMTLIQGVLRWRFQRCHEEN